MRDDEGRNPVLRWVPNLQDGGKTLRKVLAEEGIDAEVELVAVITDEKAKRLRFPGSPTIRLDGPDLFPAPEREDWRLGCRVYATPEGLRGSPTAGMIEKVLAMKEGYDADRNL